MGSSSSKDLKLYYNGKVGSLNVRLFKDYYYPGEELIGEVSINTLQDIEVNCLELKVQMDEGWYFDQVNSPQKKQNVQMLFEMSLDISESLAVLSERYFLKIGTYKFPFNIKIPDYFQPSFEYKGMNSDHLHLRYVVYSCLQAAQGEKYCLSSLNYLKLRSNPYVLSTPLSHSNTTNVKSFFFMEKGTCNLNATYSKRSYKFGDELNIDCLIDNSRSKLKVTKVKAVLTQKITFKDLFSDKNCYTNELQIKKFDVQCQPEMKMQLPVNFILNNITSNSNVQYIPPYFLPENEMFQFQPTITSSFIKCEYYIKISLEFESFVSYGYRPRIFVPISLTHKADTNELSLDFQDVIPANERTNHNSEITSEFPLYNEIEYSHQKDFNYIHRGEMIENNEIEDINAIYN